MSPKRLMVLVGAFVMALALSAPPAMAQRRGGVSRAPAHSTVVVRAGVGYGGFYRPYYSPFYFNAFYYDPLFYDPFFWGYYPFYAQYRPYPYYAYSGNWSSARLEMKPKEAQVYLDGYYVGIVDQFDGIFQRLDVPTGEHELTVYLRGYRTWHQQTLFRPGENYHFKGALEPLPPGTQQEPPPAPSPNARNMNQPGPYRQPYARPYPPQGQYPPPPPQGGEPGEYPPPPNNPGRGQTMPDRMEGGFGTLSVRVQPSDATVTIDGERWDSPDGGSRLQVQLSAGQHRIEVRKDGYRSYTSTIQIRPGDTQSLNISLPNGGLNP